MRKLSQTQIKERDEFASRLEAAATALTEALSDFNSKASDLYNEVVEPVKSEYESLLQEVEDWRLEIVSDMENYQGERSDKWQESDAASEYQSWQNEWEWVSLDAPDIDEAPELDVPELTHSEDVANLPDAPIN